MSGSMSKKQRVVSVNEGFAGFNGTDWSAAIIWKQRARSSTVMCAQGDPKEHLISETHTLRLAFHHKDVPGEIWHRPPVLTTAFSLFLQPLLWFLHIVSWPHCPKSTVVMVTPREKVVLLVSMVTRRGKDAVQACVESPAARRVHLCKCVFGFLLLMEHLALHR